MILRVCLFVITTLLLGAHFLRAGDFVLVVLCAVMPLLFCFKRRISLVLLQVSAYLATMVWLWSAYELVDYRQMMGQPWIRAAIIFGGVALFSLISGLLLNSRCMRERYPV